MCLETPQWWQTWGLTWDLELDKSVLDSYLYHLFQIGAQILDLEVMEEEGLEETAYPKPVVEGHLWKAQWKEKPNDEGHKKLTMNKLKKDHWAQAAEIMSY